MRIWLPIILALAWLYTVLRCVYFLPLHLPLRALVALVLFVIAEHYLLIRRWFGSLASPELPRAVLFTLTWLFGTFVLIFVLLVLRDLAGPLVLAVVPHVGLIVLRDPRISWAIAVLAACLAFVGVWQAVKVPNVKTVGVDLAGWPRAFEGYRIVQLSDLHLSRLLPARWARAVVDGANALGANLIVITGDLADGSVAARAADVAPLADLRAPDGVLVIAGNHEYYSGYRAWLQAYRGLGLRMLENEHVVIQRGGGALVVVGVTDRQAVTFGEPRPDLAAALAGVTRAGAIVLLDHRPGRARANARAGATLQLSGHTHGGQILGLSLFARRERWLCVGALPRRRPAALR
ncbi:MAG: metallophosphoesterase [Gammaproteobacteria bacterium]